MYHVDPLSTVSTCTPDAGAEGGGWTWLISLADLKRPGVMLPVDTAAAVAFCSLHSAGLSFLPTPHMPWPCSMNREHAAGMGELAGKLRAACGRCQPHTWQRGGLSEVYTCSPVFETRGPLVKTGVGGF